MSLVIEKQHNTRFVSVKMLASKNANLNAARLLEVASVKTGYVTSHRLCSEGTGDRVFRAIARYLSAHPDTLPSDLDIEHARLWAQSEQDEENFIFNLIFSRINSAESEGEISDEHWEEIRNATQAEYKLARDWAEQLGFRE